MARSTHHDTLYREDNKSLYHMLEEDVRKTPCAALLKPFMRGKDGREAFLAIKRLKRSCTWDVSNTFLKHVV